jgi:exodeoxyribonuclease VII small subunit
VNTPTPDVENLSYEEAVSELEEIIARLEAAQSSLEESMALFERGQALAKHCARLLEQAELRIRQVSGSDEEDA